MQIQRTTSMRRADQVATALRRELRDWQSPGCMNNGYIYPYLNGREQGLTLSVFGDGVPAFTFAENRNSDDIVVYEDPRWSSCRGNGGAPSEEVYAARKFFRTPQQAAKYIAQRLRACVAAQADREREEQKTA